MLTARQEKLIRSLHTKKGRLESGLCLVEGKKNLEEAKSFLEFTFTDKDTKYYNKLLDTTTPQSSAGVAKIPQWDLASLQERPVIVVLDNVQDPGNVGTILRLCLGFDASLLLIESADPTSPKVVRASAGALFKIPWCEVTRSEADQVLLSFKREIYRLENGKNGEKNFNKINNKKNVIVIAGSEGQGISLKTSGTALTIAHNPKLESLNVAIAVAITLYEINR